MAQKLLGYPMFLAYFTEIGQTCILSIAFLIDLRRAKKEEADRAEKAKKNDEVEIILDQSPSRWQYHKYYLLVFFLFVDVSQMAFWFLLNGVVAQFADPHVDGDLQVYFYCD
jgi:hypothetical protein